MAIATEQRRLQQARSDFERILESDPTLRDMAEKMFGRSRQARWRYYGERGARGQHPSHLYFYTTERVGAKFQSGIYHYFKSKKSWMPKEVKGHVRRKDAKARALKLFKQAKEKGS